MSINTMETRSPFPPSPTFANKSNYVWPETPSYFGSSCLATPVSLPPTVTDQVKTAVEEASLDMGNPKASSHSSEGPEYAIINGIKYMKVSGHDASHGVVPKITPKGDVEAEWAVPQQETHCDSLFGSPPIQVIVAGNANFYVHRTIMTSLLSASKVHEQQLRSLEFGNVVFLEEDPQTFRAMLELIYSESYKSHSMEIRCDLVGDLLPSVYAMAVKYNQHGVKTVLLNNWTLTYPTTEDFLDAADMVYWLTGGDEDFRAFFKQNLMMFLCPGARKSGKEFTSENLKLTLQSYLNNGGPFADDLKDAIVDFVAVKLDPGSKDVRGDKWGHCDWVEWS